MGKVIAVLSGKGGTGKSTTAAALGCALTELGRSVVCVDADTELRNLDLYLGLGDSALLDYGDVLAGYTMLQDALADCPQFPGLKLLPAPQEPVEAGFSDLIRELQSVFDYCLIDCPGGLGSIVEEAGQLSDLILLVATVDPSAHRDAERTAQLLRSKGCKEMRLLMNRVNARLLRAQTYTLDDSMDQVGLRLIGYVPEDRKAILSLSRGMPLLCGGKDRKGASAAYRRIARRIDGQKVPIG